MFEHQKKKFSCKEIKKTQTHTHTSLIRKKLSKNKRMMMKKNIKKTFERDMKMCKL